MNPNMFWGLLVLAIPALYALTLLLKMWGETQKEIDKSKDTLILKSINNLDSFTATGYYLAPRLKTGIAIDEDRKKICLIQSQHPFNLTMISFQDVLLVELIEDGVSITKTSRTSQIGGALLGSILLGGVGAVIGGLSGSKKTSTNANSIILRVVVNSTVNPDHIIHFLDQEVEKNDEIYQEAISSARKWESTLNVIIHQADMIDKKNASLPLDLSDEANTISKLERLASLKDRGVLTDDEFQAEKIKILNP
ncbi:SHOCT domain-containing protein [Ignatzschineria rhizosphaerae]|uniref:SHOCT domain-containing protein n=1 Tax=Ignatzschineria rhizosphaerae TaxID=2923279 RepID=A0ABY3X0X7_9GAMM|nr:SHOCT domain-containing protein [Ignatzschineria rhizosphaerae]UNM95960.1 SHOCT domain-containing protein [Ignatzschineria rhizosphaerae]